MLPLPMVGTTDRDNAKAALAYRRHGYSVIPIRPKAKLPLIGWEEFQHRLASEDEIAEWYRRWPDANVGIVTGAISGLVVLDIDPGHRGAESLGKLEGEHGKLPATIEAETGGGGLHFYFAAPFPVPRSRVSLFPGVDLRAEGGIVIAPPSVHPSGKRYRWIADRDPWTAKLALIPPWLESAIQGAAERRGHPVAYWRELVRTGVAQGARNTTLASLAGHLLWHGVDPEIVTELLLAWNRVRCRPPLGDDEVVRVAESIARLHARKE